MARSSAARSVVRFATTFASPVKIKTAASPLTPSPGRRSAETNSEAAGRANFSICSCEVLVSSMRTTCSGSPACGASETICCPAPSTVTRRSSGLSPSTGAPSLSTTPSVTTIRPESVLTTPPACRADDTAAADARRRAAASVLRTNLKVEISGFKSFVPSVCGGRRGGLHARGLLRDLDADRSPYARRARRQHRARVLYPLDAARGLHAQVGPDRAAHQRHVRHGRARLREAGRSLHEVRARALRRETRAHLLLVREERSLDDRLHEHALAVRRLDHGAYVVLDRAVVAALQSADVYDHVYLARAVEHRAPRLVSLNVGERRAQREPDHRADRHARPAQHARRRLHPRRIHAHAREAVLRRLLAKARDVGLARLGLQERVIDEARPVARRRRLAQHQPYARRARVHHSLHPLRAAVKARAPAPARPVPRLAAVVQTRHNRVRYLLDEPL